MTRTFGTMALALAAALAWPMGSAHAHDVAGSTLAAPQQRQLWDDARQAFREHRYAAAYGRFAALADRGHVPSAQLALAMLRHGSDLFGSAWSASVPQQSRWAALAAEDLRRQWLVDAYEGSD